MPETLIDHLVLATETGTDQDGLRFLDRRENATFLTWPEILRRALASAGTLHAAGVRSGDHVAIVLPTDPTFIDAYLGCQVLGAIPSPLYPPARLGRLDEYFDKTAAMVAAVDAVVVVTDRRVGRVLGQLTTIAPTPLGHLDASTLASGTPRQPEPVGADHVAMVQFSSGTTVAPKPVALTHRQVLANAIRITAVCRRAVPKDAPYPPAGCSWLPLYHDMGLIGCIVPAILAPGALTLIPPEVFLTRPAIWLRAISRYKATVSPAPNFAYALCAERIKDEELEGVDLSSWHMALNGAEPISTTTLRAFGDRFAPYGFRSTAMMPVYGLSEAALAVTFRPENTGYLTTRFDGAALTAGAAVPDPDGVELVSVGAPLPDFEVEIRDGERTPQADGTIGTIWARGPSLMKGYVGRDTQPFVEGWLDTGDLGFLHDGEMYVTGRRKDLIILRGRNHAPQDIERACDTVEGVRTGCAIAAADIGEEGERLLLFVEVREPREGMAEEVLRAVKGASGLEPSMVLLLEPGTLPRTSSGKLRRTEALKRWHDGSLTPPAKVTPWLLAGAMAKSAMGYFKSRRR